jgi:exonuclease VII small subunit
MAKQPQIQFEAAISELNDLIEKMEQGKGTLEAIKDAEQKIQVLVEKNGQVSLEPFKPQDD